MKVVIQRVSRATVRVEGAVVGEIGAGLLLLVGFGADDTRAVFAPVANKILNLRIFNDETGKMNLSLLDTPDPAILAVSQFTLLADIRKGRRPSYTSAAPAETAAALFEGFVDHLRTQIPKVATGIFQAHMEVDLVNDGPVTIMLDSEEL